MSDLYRDLLTIAPIDPLARWERPLQPLLTPPHGNPKFKKSTIPNYGLSLAPAEESGWNVCRFSTHLCRQGCVAFAGRGATSPVQRARKGRTQFLADHPRQFVTMLAWETHKAHVKHDGEFVMRLNTFSDLPWENLIPWYFEWANDVQFYDYTKWSPRQRPHTTLPPNYDLTLSVSEAWDEPTMHEALDDGFRLAVVVPRGQETEVTEWHGWPCVNGDLGDLRHLDPKPGITLLKAKGRLRKETGNGFGFVKDMT